MHSSSIGTVSSIGSISMDVYGMDGGYRVKGPIELYAVLLELDYHQHTLLVILYI